MEVEALLSTIKLVRFSIASSDHAGDVSQLECGVCSSVELYHCARNHSVCTTQTRPKQGSKLTDFQGISRIFSIVPLWYRQI
jgi:hypothetical protein